MLTTRGTTDHPTSARGRATCVIPKVVMPTWRRRFALLATMCVVGGGMDWVAPIVTSQLDGAVVVLTLALLAGISALWSP